MITSKELIEARASGRTRKLAKALLAEALVEIKEISHDSESALKYSGNVANLLRLFADAIEQHGKALSVELYINEE